MASERLKKLTDDMMEMHVKRYETDSSELMPMFIMHDSQDQCSVIMTPFEGEESKEAVAEYLRKFAAENDTDAVIFSSEAWALSTKTVDFPQNYRHGDLSVHPDRIEILTVVGFERGGAVVRSRQIIRDSDGNVTELAIRTDSPDADDVQVKSRFNIFDGAYALVS